MFESYRVLRGCAARWPAATTWPSAEPGVGLGRPALASRELEVACASSSSNVFYGDAHNKETVSISFGAFLAMFSHAAALPADLSLYLCQCALFSSDPQIPAVLPELMDDIELPQDLNPAFLIQVNIWMNCLPSQSNVHYDMSDNILCVISGCKRVRLFPPSLTHVLCPRAVFASSPNHSVLDVEATKKIDGAVDIELGPGDALYIPEGWWHQVDSVPSTIGVNFWFQGARERLIPNDFASVSAHGVEVYYARLLLEGLVQKELANMRLHQLAMNDDCEESWSGDRLEQEYDALKGAPVEQCGACLVRLPLSVQKRVLPRLAAEVPAKWKDILLGLSATYADALLQCWERGAAREIDEKKTGKEKEHMDGASLQAVSPRDDVSMCVFYRQLFECFGDCQMDIQRALVAKREALSRLAFQNVMSKYIVSSSSSGGESS